MIGSRSSTAPPTDGDAGRRRAYSERDVVLLVQAHEFLETQLDGVELRRERFLQVVGVAAERVVRDPGLRGRADDRVCLRVGETRDRRTLNLRHAQAVTAHACFANAGRSCATARDRRAPDTAGRVRHTPPQTISTAALRHFIGGAQPLEDCASARRGRACAVRRRGRRRWRRRARAPAAAPRPRPELRGGVCANVAGDQRPDQRRVEAA